MTKVGIAGIGFMGWIHWLAYQELPDVEVVAIATPEAERRAGDWTGIQGNFGPPGTQIDLTGVKTYENLQAMLADSDLEVDCVDICLPPAMHCDAIQAAAKAGKHVFLRKTPRPQPPGLRRCCSNMQRTQSTIDGRPSATLFH